MEQSTAQSRIPFAQSWEGAMADLDASEQEFGRGEFISGDEFDHACKQLLGKHSVEYAY